MFKVPQSSIFSTCHPPPPLSPQQPALGTGEQHHMGASSVPSQSADQKVLVTSSVWVFGCQLTSKVRTPNPGTTSETAVLVFWGGGKPFR